MSAPDLDFDYDETCEDCGKKKYDPKLSRSPYDPATDAHYKSPSQKSNPEWWQPKPGEPLKTTELRWWWLARQSRISRGLCVCKTTVTTDPDQPASPREDLVVGGSAHAVPSEPAQADHLDLSRADAGVASGEQRSSDHNADKNLHLEASAPQDSPYRRYETQELLALISDLQRDEDEAIREADAARSEEDRRTATGWQAGSGKRSRRSTPSSPTAAPSERRELHSRATLQTKRGRISTTKLKSFWRIKDLQRDEGQAIREADAARSEEDRRTATGWQSRIWQTISEIDAELAHRRAERQANQD